MRKTRSIEERKHALRLYKQACKITALIMQRYNIGEYDAIASFYCSTTYELLSNYNTRIWWYSVYAIFEIYKTEKETGSVINSPYIIGKYA
jgi:uncharacterized membrane protein